MATEPVAREVDDVVETVEVTERPHGSRRVWSWLWPKLAALALFICIWQVVVWSGWRPDYLLPGPLPVFQRLWQDLSQPDFYAGVAVTLRRALVGYAIAIAIGSALGVHSMPSILCLPMAVLLFQSTESAILLVVILGAAPAVATGLLSGIDQVQPLLVRVGRVLGARGLQLYRHVILPAALPGYLGGLKQGWAFAWRSLMAGEIINIVSHQPSLGQQLQFARDFVDAQQLYALMIVIFFIGVTVDLAFGFADRAVRRRRGLA